MVCNGGECCLKWGKRPREWEGVTDEGSVSDCAYETLYWEGVGVRLERGVWVG